MTRGCECKGNISHKEAWSVDPPSSYSLDSAAVSHTQAVRKRQSTVRARTTLAESEVHAGRKHGQSPASWTPWLMCMLRTARACSTGACLQLSQLGCTS